MDNPTLSLQAKLSRLTCYFKKKIFQGASFRASYRLEEVSVVAGAGAQIRPTQYTIMRPTDADARLYTFSFLNRSKQAWPTPPGEILIPIPSIPPRDPCLCHCYLLLRKELISSPLHQDVDQCFGIGLGLTDIPNNYINPDYLDTVSGIHGSHSPPQGVVVNIIRAL